MSGFFARPLPGTGRERRDDAAAPWPPGDGWNGLRCAAPVGSLDPAWFAGAGTDGWVCAIAALPDGRVMLGGDFTTCHRHPRRGVARLLANGRVDPSFDPGAGADEMVTCLDVDDEGRILVGGAFTAFAGAIGGGVVRLLDDGTVDRGFDCGCGANDSVQAMAADAAGRLLVGGRFTHFDGLARTGLVRLLGNGAVDPGFVPDLGRYATVYSVAALPDGRILVGGRLHDPAAAASGVVARLLPDGTRDPSFAGAWIPDSMVNAVRPLAGGRLAVGGAFSRQPGGGHGGLVVLGPDGALDDAFHAGTGPNGPVTAVLSRPDGGLIVAGLFSTWAGRPRGGVARIAGDGTLDPAFQTGYGAGGTVFCLATLGDGSVIAGGSFDAFQGVPVGHCARIFA